MLLKSIDDSNDDDDSIVDVNGHKYLKLGDKYIPFFESLKELEEHIKTDNQEGH